MSRTRVVVDRIEFGELVRFPLILRGVTQALHPPRLVVGLLMVVALMSVGKLWDRWFDTPSINPAGIIQPELTTYELEESQRVLRNVVGRLDNSIRESVGLLKREDVTEGVPWPNLDARVIAEAFERQYRYDRAQRVEVEVNLQTLEEEDRRFFATMAEINGMRPRGAFEAVVEQVSYSFKRIVLGVVTLEPMEVGRGFSEILVQTPVRAWELKPWFCLFYGFFALVALSLGGGALSRMAACEIAGRERLRVNEAIDFALAGSIRLITTPLLPLLIAGFLAIVLMAVGVVGFLPWLDLIGGVLYGLLIVLGFLIAFVLLCFAGGFLMVIPAVAAENCGPVYAHERAYAYLLARPLHLLGYVAVGLIGLALGYFVVGLFIVTTLNITGATVGALSNNSALSVAGGFELFRLEPLAAGEFHASWHERSASWLVSLWQTLLVSLVAAYVFSYIFTCSTAIYLLMRRLVDHQDVSEIWRPGLVPGTLAPLPVKVHEHSSGDEAPAASAPDVSRADSAMSGVIRKVATLGFGGKGDVPPASTTDKPSTEAPVVAPAAEPPLKNDEPHAEPEVELGPELLSGDQAAPPSSSETSETEAPKKKAKKGRKSKDASEDDE